MTAITQKKERTVKTTETTLPASVLVIGILGMLALMGLFAAVGRLIMGLGASTALSDRYSWGIWIGFDFFLIALSGAGFTMAGLAHGLRREKYHAAVRPAILAGLMGYSAVLMILLLDLGRFDRFYHFLIFWNLHSPLFEICWCVLLYTTILVIEVSPSLFERLGWTRALGWVERIMLPATIIGVTLSSLHQSTLGTLYLNMPHRLHALWYTPLLPLLFFLSSIMAGLALTLFVYPLAAQIRGEKVQPQVLTGLARIAGWVSALFAAIKLGEIIVARELPLLLAFDQMSLLMWAELGLGAIVPAVLLLLPKVRAQKTGQFISAGLILMGVFISRFSATMFAQTPPGGAAPYTPHFMEWLTTFGILAGAALVWYLAVRLLNIFEHQAHH
jgi:Ni/Fe-hydrogenase subunit HybB-like protein